MLRKSIVMFLCLSVFISISNSSFAGQVNISDGYVTIPVGGGIVFPGGSILNNSAGITGPMGPMGPQGPQGPAASGSIIANANIVYCYGVTECYCAAGQVVKAALSVKCDSSDMLSGTYLLDAGATGWGADCEKFIKDIGPPPNNYESYYFTWVPPHHIVIACITP